MRMVVVLVGGAPLFLKEVCASALLSGHQRSSLPAGQGSHGSDLHLREVEGQQVALPRFPVHALAEGHRLKYKRKTREKGEKQVRRRTVRDTQRGVSQKAPLAWQTGRMTNTNKYQPLASFHMSTNLFSLLLHFTNKHCRRHLQPQYYGWNLDKSRDLCWHFLQYQSPLDIITVVVTLSVW